MIPFMVAVARPHGVGDSIYSGDSKTTATWMSLAIARSQLVAAYWDHDADAKGGKRTICTYFGKPATSTIIGLCGLLEAASVHTMYVERGGTNPAFAASIIMATVLSTCATMLGSYSPLLGMLRDHVIDNMYYTTTAIVVAVLFL
mmetsp:Transcript_20701/g.62984  ORF Transcript_20701/g.62984 Transcript_20701/m.62984 type:complete len:145 (+) Transcript_20701:622-1056(+)